MTARSAIIDLSGLVLPGEATLRRQHVRKPARRTEHYLSHYDRRTLIYDCVYQADRRRFLMICPPLFNLWAPLRAGLRMDGRPATGLRRRRFDKFSVLTLPGGPAELGLSLESGPMVLRARSDIAERFRGLNCLVTLNKDNALSWIADWARWHVARHAAQGIVIFDNASTAYAPGDVASTLAGIEGLREVVIARTPYPYGTTDRVAPGELRPNFLQPAMLNLARADLLRHARAVLNADIDELVLSRDATSVFDAAAARPNLALRLPVRWAYPAPDVTGPAPQRAHVYRDADKRRSNRKWCVVPSGLLSRFGGWHVHHVGGEVFKILPEDFAHEIVHCRATSTGWNDRKGRHVEMPALGEDPELVAAMAGLTGRAGGHAA